MDNVLLYSPRFEGHRQVNTFVQIDILLKLGCNIYIAGNQNFEKPKGEYPYLEYLDRHSTGTFHRYP